jgi:hypothetical protein
VRPTVVLGFGLVSQDPGFSVLTETQDFAAGPEGASWKIEKSVHLVRARSDLFESELAQGRDE